ncbi:MAG: SGNH/GDSL hydrolase family protein, partial [Clostridiales bacterium]|nr:SGNH/GDSL hydrolase family protein [Clostridiales bacterium]
DYDYTLLEFGGNDCDLLWNEIAEDPSGTHLPLVPLDKFRQLYLSMIARVRAAGSTPVMMSLPPLVADKFFSWVSKGLDKDNILEFLKGDKEYIYRWHEGYNDMVNEIAREQNVPVIDIRSAVLQQPDYESLVCLDGMHPNGKGHKVIADYLEKAIEDLFRSNNAADQKAC